MKPERKTTMLSARVPPALVARVDFIVRNTTPDQVKNRSVAVQIALEAWLPGEEQKLEDLGVIPKKAR